MAGKFTKDSQEIRSIIDKSEYCVLSLVEGDAPYAVPLNVAYDGEFFYLHSRHNGRKIEALKRNPKVFLTFVPEAAFVQHHARTACGASMCFESVCARGAAEVLGPDSPLEERRAGLLCLARRFGIADLPMDEAVLAKTTVIRIKSEEVIGLRKPGQPG